jgi:hypothetical protein
MLGSRDVKGEATELSASDRDMPVWAAFNAPQSLAPSPHIAEEKKSSEVRKRGVKFTKT